MNDTCFKEITNNDIYNEIKTLGTDFNKIKTRVKINTWCSATALSLVVGIFLGILIK